jgi:hypothetical protein
MAQPNIAAGAYNGRDRGVPAEGSVSVNVVFRLAYGLAVAIFYILLVIFGQRTFYSEPDYPSGLSGPPVSGLYCDKNDCFLNGERLDESRDSTLGTLDREYVARFRSYQSDRDDYSRMVFAISGLLGAAAIAAGVFFYRRVEGLPLGLVLGGIGVVIYGWVESSRDEGNVDATVAFLVAAVGFIVLVAGGYWFLGSRQREAGAASG